MARLQNATAGLDDLDPQNVRGRVEVRLTTGEDGVVSSRLEGHGKELTMQFCRISVYDRGFSRKYLNDVQEKRLETRSVPKTGLSGISFPP